MKSKWASGIPPRNLTWVLPEVLAAAERPGGQSATHRKVRRQEEIIWLRENDFNVVISILEAPQNLAAYAELGLASSHHPIPTIGDLTPSLTALYAEMVTRQRRGEKVLVHGDELGDRTIGIVAGYLVWSGRLEGAPLATSVIERLFGRQLGPAGRGIIATAAELPQPS